MHPNACMRESMAEARSVCLSVAARLTRFAGRAWRPWCTKGSGERGEGSKWWGVGGREGQARRNGSFWSHRWLGLVCRGGPSVGRVHCGMQACRPTMVHMRDEKREEGASWVGQREVGCSVVRAGGRRRARGGVPAERLVGSCSCAECIAAAVHPVLYRPGAGDGSRQG